MPLARALRGVKAEVHHRALLEGPPVGEVPPPGGHVARPPAGRGGKGRPGWRTRILVRPGIALALTLLAGVLFPGVARGQAGFYVTPSLGVGQVYDDNLFSTSSDRKRDFISRFSPGMEAGYRSAPLTLLGRYSFDAEVYAEHPELNDPQVRQEAGLEFRYLPTRVLTLGLNGSYLRTLTPSELNVTTGIVAGRVRAQRISTTPSGTVRFDPLTTGTVDYTFVHDDVSGGSTTDTHTANVGVDRRITAQDTGSLGYNFRQFDFDGGTTASHAFILGWTRDLTPQTSIALRAGPRFSEGSVDPEVSATIRHRLREGDLSFAYARTQTTAIGLAGSVNTESFTAAARYRPLRFLEVSLTPGFFRSTRTAELRAYRVSLDASYRITEWLSLVGSYVFGLQRGRLDAGPPAGEVHRNVVFLRLVAAYPVRLY